MSYRKVPWSCQYAPALETPQSPFLYQPGWSDWVPQSVHFPTQKQQSNPRLKRLAGCVGEHFWHFSCVQTSTTILIASSTDWLKMCVVIIIFKGQSHFKQTRYVLTWSIPYFPQYDPWLWKQVQETCNKQGPHESHDFNHYCFKVTISSVQGCTISYPRGVLGLYHDGGEGGSHCFEALLSLGWYFGGVEGRYRCGI